jgi:Putative 2OG-Fe(II) oxygenase
MIESKQFPNVGYVFTKFTSEQLAPVVEEIEKIRSNFNQGDACNSYLAGNIKQEFYLHDSKLAIDSLIRPMIIEFEKSFADSFTRGVSSLTKDVEVELAEAWVNFQKKHEFNPLHNHGGVFSFVIWIQLPYLMPREIYFGPGRESNAPLCGYFAFSYINSIGEICNYNIGTDQTMENSAVLFPAKMMHQVFPFYTSDDYRISVAGNYKLKV